ncbi:MAG: N-acetylmuramoyl-L-alanine amidase [Prochlorothrix sp.]
MSPIRSPLRLSCRRALSFPIQTALRGRWSRELLGREFWNWTRLDWTRLDWKLLGRKLLVGGMGIAVSLLAALPAEAARLLNWRFDRAQNRLEFTTDTAVQPRAQLLANPTRIVIDLPGTSLGRPLAEELLGNGLQSLRVGQFDQDTTRLVLELAPGFQVNPQQINVQGVSPTQWVVQLPQLDRNGSPAGASVPPTATTPTGVTYLESWRATPDGLFIATQGGESAVVARRSRDQRTIELDITNSTLNPALLNQSFSLPNLAIESLTFRPVANQPNLSRITLTVPPNAPDWRASLSNLGGIILLPRRRPTPIPGQPTSTAPMPGNLPASQPPSPVAAPAQIQSVSLDRSGTQLLIQSDRPLQFSAQPEGNEYRVRLFPAQLRADVQGPNLSTSSLLQRVRLRQDDTQTVSIFIEPAPGVQIDIPRPLSPQMLSLTLREPRSILVPAPTLPDPSRPPSPSPYPSTTPSIPLPSVPQGRFVVVIDPGHGGRDPGAVGRGGLQEKQVVFPVAQQVAALLTQQGVQVVMTRYDDREVDLEPRVQVAERANATVFVSIHANAISLNRPDINGVETYYYGSNEGRRLAQTIHQSLLENVAIRDRQVREARFYVIRRTSMPATLVEVGFVTGAEDAPRLADPAHRSRIAAAIAQGILRYLQ